MLLVVDIVYVVEGRGSRRRLVLELVLVLRCRREGVVGCRSRQHHEERVGTIRHFVLVKKVLGLSTDYVSQVVLCVVVAMLLPLAIDGQTCRKGEKGRWLETS